MGAWGVLAFDNDEANDWAYGLEELEDLSLVESAFKAVRGTDEYLESREGSSALAACEVLARLLGNFGYQNSYTEKIDQWVKAHPVKPSPELLDRASCVIARVLEPSSELREEWDGNSSWLEAVEDLRGRLRT